MVHVTDSTSISVRKPQRRRLNQHILKSKSTNVKEIEHDSKEDSFQETTKRIEQERNTISIQTTLITQFNQQLSNKQRERYKKQQLHDK